MSGRRLWALLAVALATVLTVPAHAQVSQESPDNSVSQLYAAVLAGLQPDDARPPPRVAIDPSGDATVEFAILTVDDDAAATRAAALGDTLSVFRAIYASSVVQDVRTVTVLGTFPFKGTKSPGVRPTPVLRAVLSADHAQRVDWQTVRPSEVPDVVDVWWLQGAFAEVGRALSSSDDNAVDARLALALAHLDESLRGLETGQLRIARSQFTQFFDAWDDVSDDVGQRYPAEYDAIDVDLERAETALLHTQPEDVDTARVALVDLRATLADLSSRAS